MLYTTLLTNTKPKSLHCGTNVPYLQHTGKEAVYSMHAGTHGLSLCSHWNRIQVVLCVLGCFLVHRKQIAHSTTAAAVHSPAAAFAWRAIKLLSRKKQILALRLGCSLELGYSHYPVLEVQHSHHLDDDDSWALLHRKIKQNRALQYKNN